MISENEAYQRQLGGCTAVPNGDELRRIAHSVRTSASDDASPTEYVLAGWKAAMLAASPTPQQEAQEPDHSLRTDTLCQLAYCNGMKAGWNYCVDGNEVGFARAMEGVSEAIKVLMELRENAPQPAPAPLSDDAERLREALERIGGASITMHASLSDMLEHCQDIARAALRAQGEST